jgi:hypothetical protein
MAQLTNDLYHCHVNPSFLKTGSVKHLVVALLAPGDRKIALRLRFRPVLSDVEGMTNPKINST